MEFVYYNKLVLTNCSWHELIDLEKFGVQFNVDYITSKCIDEIVERINVENCCSVLNQSKNPKVHEKCVQIIIENYHDMNNGSKREELRSIPTADLLEISRAIKCNISKQ